MAMYRKAAAYKGKSLSVMVGRGDLTLRDNIIYTDDRLAKFIERGWVELVEEKTPTPAPAPASAPAKTAPAPAPVAETTAAPEAEAVSTPAPAKDDEGSVTRSPASKAKAPGRRTSTKKIDS